VNDACGVCNGDNSSCTGCDGTPNSGLVNDACGVCDGDNSTCSGCDGVPNSGLENDACGVCDGDNSTCAGCDGVPNSGLANDACGVCNGDNSTCLGCDGVPNSGLVNDACSVCGGDNSTCAGCDGVPNSGLQWDCSWVCGGTDLSCAGCDGVPFSTTTFDACGVCDGDNSTCAGCDGIANSGLVNDACGVCGGNNSTCLGCDDVVNSGLVIDDCGVCGGDHSTCACCPGWTGTSCETQDLCYSTECENDGICDPLTGKCACMVGYTGENCEILSCSDNGYYDGEQCVCLYGWSGEDCSICKEPEEPDKTYVCMPTANSQRGYVLMPVKTNQLKNWLSGKRVSVLQSRAEHKTAILPNSYDEDGMFRNCRCEVVDETELSRIVSVQPRKFNVGKDSTIHHQMIGGKLSAAQLAKKEGFNIRSNSVLASAKNMFESSEKAIQKMDHYKNVRFTLDRWKHLKRAGIDNNEEIGHLVLSRSQRGSKISLQRERHINIIINEDKKQTDAHLFGGNAVRGWVDKDSVFWVVRDDESPFFQDIIEECIAESELSMQEMGELSEIYQECIDAYEETSGNLDQCTSTCKQHCDDSETCSALAIAFWPLLGVSILLCIVVFSLGVCFIFRPYRYRRSVRAGAL